MIAKRDPEKKAGESERSIDRDIISHEVRKGKSPRLWSLNTIGWVAPLAIPLRLKE